MHRRNESFDAIEETRTEDPSLVRKPGSKRVAVVLGEAGVDIARRAANYQALQRYTANGNLGSELIVSAIPAHSKVISDGPSVVRREKGYCTGEQALDVLPIG